MTMEAYYLVLLIFFFLFFCSFFFPFFFFNLAMHQDVSSQWERKSETDALAVWVQRGRFLQWKMKYLGKSILDYVNSRCFGSVPFKYTCVCSEVTCQEAILPGGLDSCENGIYWPTDILSHTTWFYASTTSISNIFFFLNLDGASLELSNPHCSEP